MKMKRILPLFVAFTGSMSLAYFWEDWGKQVSPQEKIEKQKLDLDYQKKAADVDFKKQQARQDIYDKSVEKQQKLEHKKQDLELDRQKKRLQIEQKY